MDVRTHDPAARADERGAPIRADGSPPHMTRRYKTAIIAQARWEHHDICEWVEYHKLIGFEHIFIYSNDDHPFEIRSRLSPYLFGGDPFVTLFHWPVKGQQFLIYYDFLCNLLHTVEWFSFLDIDEFFVLKQHSTIGDFIESIDSHFDSINFNWVIYGNCDRLVRDPSLYILPSYTRRNSHPNVHTKNITRSSAVEVAKIRPAFDNNALGFWHFWDRYPFPGMRIGNVLGENDRGYTEDFPNRALQIVRGPGFAERILNSGYIAHFQLKSEADFLRRVRRGGSANTEYFRQTFENGEHKTVLSWSNAVEDTYLAWLWLDHLRPMRARSRYSYVPTPKHDNIALWCPSSQSSVSKREADTESWAALGWCRDHANDGFRSGKTGFETQEEQGPWWLVDLLSQHQIVEIHLYNCIRDNVRVDLPPLSIDISDDRTTWRTLGTTAGGAAFGGIDGKPLIVTLPTPMGARYVRVAAKSSAVLKLNEVEVYGY